jgi:hypothetical protein
MAGRNSPVSGSLLPFTLIEAATLPVFATEFDCCHDCDELAITIPAVENVVETAWLWWAVAEQLTCGDGVLATLIGMGFIVVAAMVGDDPCPDAAAGTVALGRLSLRIM